ncbi:MAG: YCF48-related protein [Gammaproteobacteria bacterium]|nr:YCF48-related protein [Gammaproteobacteria bacterium]MDH3768869.1 YCF48-related protein [Gammaproteobacteria bacterium]
MLRIIATMLALLAVASTVAAEYPQKPAAGEAFIAPLATRAMLLDGVNTDGRIAVVGEHGIVLISDDEGVSWRQVQTHTRATLTGVHFHDKDTGWVVGHDAIILRTLDGGTSWQQVHFNPDDQRPLFDVWFADATRGFAIGAYGLFLSTTDGGSSWESKELIPEPWPDLASTALETEPDEFDFEDDQYYDFHLNHIVSGDAGDLYIAAEAGNFFRSGDGGETWYSMPTTYQGSFFSVLPLQAQNILLMGLRGNLFSSTNGGEAFIQVDTPVTVLLNDGAVLSDGTVLIGGMAGALLESTDDGASFELRQQANRKAISVLLPVSDAIIIIGEAGVHRVTLEQLRKGGNS